MEKGIKDLLIDELHDLLSCEEQIVDALPNMVAAAESSELKKAFSTHLKETKTQIQRLKKIFKIMKIVKKSAVCKATKGLILESKDVLKNFKKKSPVRDAALISKAQRIEHYEIAAYGSVHTFAKEASLYDVANLLQETLSEEGNAYKLLTKIAEGGLLTSGINHKANILTDAEIKKGIADKKRAVKEKKASATAKKTYKTNSKVKRSTGIQPDTEKQEGKPNTKSKIGSKGKSASATKQGTAKKNSDKIRTKSTRDISKKNPGLIKAAQSAKNSKSVSKNGTERTSSGRSSTAHVKPAAAIKKRAVTKGASARK